MPEITWPFLFAGIALCVGGWVFYWIGIQMAGALVGASLGLAGAWALAPFLGPTARTWIVPLGGVAGFGLGIFVMRGLHRFAFFLVGAGLGLGAGQAFFLWAVDKVTCISRAPDFWQWGLMIFGATLGGVLMVRGSRAVVALVTSVVGAFLVVTSIDQPLMLLAFIPLVLGSFFLQMGFLRLLMPPPAEEKDERDEDDEER